MTQLVWGTAGERFYEAGVDRGVLYIAGIDGIAWNGLVSVNEAPVGGEVQPYYLDGLRYFNLGAAEEYAATLDAYSSPPEFAQCDGTVSIQNGLFLTQQPKKPFNLSYRTKIGNDTEGIDHGYKIHLVYNALASTATRANTTLSSSASPITLSWEIATVPPEIVGYKPTSHFVVDSRYTPSLLLIDIEDILYGTEATAPRIPDVTELLSLFVA